VYVLRLYITKDDERDDLSSGTQNPMKRDEMNELPNVYDDANEKKMQLMIFVTRRISRSLKNWRTAKKMRGGVRQPLGSDSLGKLWL